MAGYLLKANYGVFEDFDIGIHYESLNIGVRAKYGWINSQVEGWSLSTAIGAGRSSFSTHYYGDLMLGYLKKPWEPYGTLRIVRVKTDPVEFESESHDSNNYFAFNRVESFEFTYGQIIFGSRYWTQPKWFLSGEISTLLVFDSSVQVSTGYILSGAMGHRF